MGYGYAFGGDSANLRLKDNTSKNIVLYTPYANTVSFEVSSDQIYASAKGARAVRWDINKQAKLNVEMEIFSKKWLAILLGGTWSASKVDVAKKEVAVIPATPFKITLTKTPVANSIAIFKLLDDGIGHDGAALKAGLASGDDYSVAGADITFAATLTGKTVVVYYLYETASAVDTLSIKDALPAQSYEIIGDTTMKRKYDGVEEYVQFRCGHSVPLIGSTINFSATGATNLTATFDLMPDGSQDVMTITQI